MMPGPPMHYTDFLPKELADQAKAYQSTRQDLAPSQQQQQQQPEKTSLVSASSSEEDLPRYSEAVSSSQRTAYVSDEKRQHHQSRPSKLTSALKSVFQSKASTRSHPQPISSATGLPIPPAPTPKPATRSAAIKDVRSRQDRYVRGQMGTHLQLHG